MLDIETFAGSDELFDSHYKLVRPISVDGGTADVWLALDANIITDKEVLGQAPLMESSELYQLDGLQAIKIFNPEKVGWFESESGEQKFREEYVIVEKCHHTNLITPKYYSKFQDTPYLVLPFCKMGSSEQFIGNLTKEEHLWKYILDVASGLDYLHKYNPQIIHQDIKPANVLIDDIGNYAITDFGLSVSKKNCLEKGDSLGTQAYVAPERFEEGYEPKPESDIWAFGATLYEMITGRVPFGEEGGEHQKDGLVSLTFPKGINTEIQKLICDCLDKNAAKRPTASQLVEAAQTKRYPKPKPPILKMIIGVMLILLVGALMMIFPRTKTDPGSTPVPSDSIVRESPSLRYDSIASEYINTSLALIEAGYEYKIRHPWDLFDTDSIVKNYKQALTAINNAVDLRDSISDSVYRNAIAARRSVYDSVYYVQDSLYNFAIQLNDPGQLVEWAEELNKYIIEEERQSNE